MTQQIPEDAIGTFIGECADGSCGCPATITVRKGFVLCSLHYAELVLGEDVDEMNLAVELMTGWKGQAQHHDNHYLERLLSRAIEDCMERRDDAEAIMSDVQHGRGVESEPNHDYRSSLKPAKDDQQMPDTVLEPASTNRMCAVGSATDNPCKLPAEVAVNSEEPDWCVAHAKSYELKEMLSDLEAEIHGAMDSLAERTDRITGRVGPAEADRDSA